MGAAPKPSSLKSKPPLPKRSQCLIRISGPSIFTDMLVCSDFLANGFRASLPQNGRFL